MHRSAAALGVHLQRFVAELLDYFEDFVTVITLIFVERHIHSKPPQRRRLY